MGRFWIITIVVVVLALLVGGGVGGHHVSKQNAFCITCHAYEKVSWDHGDHFFNDCLDCHTKGLVTDKVHGVRKVYLMFTGQNNPHNDPPSRLYPEKTSDNCTDCHMTSEVEANEPEFFAQHTGMMENFDTCQACHDDSGHDPELQALRFEAPRFTQEE
ncbi:MAG: NapC/NirT family cytochrome c [Pseudomonadota bacterium]